MITEAKSLNECETRLIIDDTKGEEYSITIAPVENIIVVMGFKSNHAGAKFTESTAASIKSVHEFKHYRSSGSKFWTASAGVDKYFIIPKSQIKILPEKGYSYIPVEINGAKLKFNVSGGGGSEGWTDWLGECVHTFVNTPVKTLKKVAAVALKDQVLPLKDLEGDELRRWNELAAKTGDTKAAIIDLIEGGKRPKIILAWKYSYHGQQEGEGVKTSRKYQRSAPDAEGTVRLEQTGAVKGIYISFGVDQYDTARTKLTQIDWLKTAEANNVK